MIRASSAIPYPAALETRGKPPIYPWRTMAVGASFPVKVSIGSARSTAINAAKRTGRKFAAGTHRDQVRIWRLK